MNTSLIKLKQLFFFGSGLVLLSGCWTASNEVDFAGFPENGTVFLDGFSGGLEYLPFDGSNFGAFTVDNEVFYEGTASMRFDVPNGDDPDGNFAGAIFPDYGGRNLTGFDALTFWAKGSESTFINEIGFGNDFGDNTYQTTVFNLRLSTTWQKYVIPIPDPAKLTREQGLFWYSTGARPEGLTGQGYTFWIDELQFEKLGTVAQPRPAILNGLDVAETSFTGSSPSVTGLTQTYNLADGTNQTVGASPSYFTFSSSDGSVATVNALGVISVLGQGTTTITASLGGVPAAGSLELTSTGAFDPAPTPTEAAADVISVFSDAYENINVDFYNGYWAPFQTTQGQNDLNIDGDNVIRYTELNFVGTEFKNPTVNASGMSHLHIDVRTPENIDPGDFIRIELGDFGPDGAFGGNNDSSGSIIISSNQLARDEWISLDIPLANFGLGSRSNMAQIIFVTDGSISELLVDNMYFYSE
ncbi:MAG: Ig-like domain-containing protein [Bacteroidota bacterium]